MKRVALIAVIAACSSKKAPPPAEGSGTASDVRVSVQVGGVTAANPTPDETRLAPMFDELGDRIAVDLRAAAARPHKSRVGAAEELALATPASFYRYPDVLATYHVTTEDLRKVGTSSDALVHLVNRMVARTKDAQAALEKSLAGLPATDPDDCVALVRRMIVVMRSKGDDRELAPRLVPFYDDCTPVLPARVKRCMGSMTPEAFDACLTTAP